MLLNYLLSDATERDTPNITIACMGDSLTECIEFQAPKLAGWPKLIEMQTGIKMINAGISGNRTDQMLNRFQRDVVSCFSTHCIIFGGVNDIFTKIPVSVISNNMDAMVCYCKSSNIIPIMVTAMPHWDFWWRFVEGEDAGVYDPRQYNFYPEQSGELPALRQWQVQYCQENGIALVDLYNTEMLTSPTTQDLSYYYADREHMNAKGNMVIAKTVLAKLETILPAE